MSFFECEFPRTISYRATGGSRFFTTINEGFSGFEQRNQNWSQSRGKWSVSLQTPAAYAGNRQPFIDLVHAFFLNVAGRAGAFRLKDHKDFQATGQALGTGSGTAGQTFQLVKNYSVGGLTYTRAIQKPVAPPAVDYQGNALPNTVKLYFGGTLQPATSYSVDATTGIVTVTAAISSGVAVTADCEFHFPVRFDTDDFMAQIEESDIEASGPQISWNSITLVEVRLGNGGSGGGGGDGGGGTPPPSPAVIRASGHNSSSSGVPSVSTATPSGTGPAQAGDYAMSFLWTTTGNNGWPFTAGSGYSLQQAQQDGVTSYACTATEDGLVAASGNLSATFGVTGSSIFWGEYLLVFANKGAGYAPVMRQKAQGKTGTGFTTISVAFGTPLLAGSLLVAFAYINLSDGPNSTITDTLGNTWIKARVEGSPPGLWDAAIALWYCTSSVAGTDSVTVNSAGTNLLQLQIYEVTGA